jgi:hypothetical protein
VPSIDSSNAHPSATRESAHSRSVSSETSTIIAVEPAVSGHKHIFKSLVHGIRAVDSGPVLTYDNREADLIPGLYEGGHVVWEGSIDLCNFLHRCYYSGHVDCPTVLELGCGAAAPTIYIMSRGLVKAAVLSDFNVSVLKDTTWPTIIENIPSWRDLSVRCLAGDWDALTNFIHDHSDTER